MAALVTKLKYGNTNTYFIRGAKGSILLDTDYAGTLPMFYKAIKVNYISLKDITYILATHYHPDHMGLAGEIASTPSHSEDSITLVLDSGDCFVGDLEPMEHMDGYEENSALRGDWEKVMSFCPRVIHYGHAPERMLVHEMTSVLPSIV